MGSRLCATSPPTTTRASACGTNKRRRTRSSSSTRYPARQGIPHGTVSRTHDDLRGTCAVQVFSPTSTQAMIFEDVEPLATSVLDGYVRRWMWLGPDDLARYHA